jgi:hypothetical protein
MLAITLLAAVLSQTPTSSGIDPGATSAHLLPQLSEPPASAAWSWAGAIGGGVAGTSIGLNVALQTASALPPRAQGALATSLYVGAIGVGLVGGAISGYLLGRAAREGWVPGKIAVWTIWGVLSTAATIAIGVLAFSVMAPHPTNLEQNAGSGVEQRTPPT